MTPTEAIVYKLIKQIYRDTGKPVRTLALSVHLVKDPRIVRYTLVRMEQQGIILRKGQRGGWLLPTPMIVPSLPLVTMPVIAPPKPKRAAIYTWNGLPV